MKPGHHPARDVHREGQPRAADRKPLSLIDHDNVDKRVINLDKVQWQ